MNGIGHFTAVALKDLAEFLNHVLGLGHSHPVTGHKTDVVGGFENVVGVLDRDGLNLTFDGFTLFNGTETAEQNVGQRAVHRLTHDVGEDNTTGTNQGTGDNQDVVADGKTRRASRNS